MKRETEPCAWGFLAGAYFFIAALIVAQLSCAYPKRPSTAGELRTADTTAFAVEVATLCDGRELGRGSGVMIGGDVVLTAWHAVRCNGVALVIVRLKTGEAYLSTIAKQWPKRDLAKLHAIGLPARPRVAISNVLVGDRLCSASIAPFLRSVCGRVDFTYPTVCPNNDWCHSGYTLADGPSIPGNSGSAMYNRDGALVALLTGGTPLWMAQPFVMFTDLWDLREDLQ